MKTSYGLIFACALTATAIFSTPALSHGDYDWINKGGYRNQTGDHCCGKDDCFRLSAKEVEENRDGYRVPSHGVTVPYSQVQRSEDEHYWICRTSAKMRCFFAPLNGF